MEDQYETEQAPLQIQVETSTTTSPELSVSKDRCDVTGADTVHYWYQQYLDANDVCHPEIGSFRNLLLRPLFLHQGVNYVRARG